MTWKEFIDGDSDSDSDNVFSYWRTCWGSGW